METYHSVIFAALSGIGLELMAFAYALQGTGTFLTLAVLFLGIFVFEALISLRFAENIKAKLPLPHLIDDIKHIHISHHIVLPMLLYMSICGFIFYNRVSLQTQLVIILGVLTFFTIFQSQRISFKKEFTFDETLNYLYDAIKIIIYFLGIDIIIQSQIYFSFGSVISFILAESLSFILFLLIIVRKNQFNSIGMLYIFLSSIFSAGITVLLIGHMPVLTIALISGVIYYLLVAVIHHKINASLTFSVIVEYLIVAVIIFLALRGIAG